MAMEMITGMSVNPYSQRWRCLDFLEANLAALAKAPLQFDRAEDTEELSKLLCPIEWAYQHPEKFDTSIAPIITWMRDLMLHPQANPALHQCYEVVMEDCLLQYAEQSAAGGTVSTCIRYNTAAQLQAALPLLDPATRYPCYAGQHEDLVLQQPRYGATDIRLTSNFLRMLWDTGLVCQSYELLDDRTLFMTTKAPLSGVKRRLALGIFRFDMTRLEEFITSRKVLPEDKIADEDKLAVAEIVSFIEPIQGSPRVGIWDHPTELTFGDDAQLDKLLESGEEPHEFLPRLFGTEYQRLDAMVS